MKIRTTAWIISFAAAVGATCSAFADAQYRVARTFEVGGPGFWDYMTVDPVHNLLYVTRTTHTMVLDAGTGALRADIPGQKRNHGVALVPSVGRGFITDGADGSVVIFDLKTYKVLGKVKAADDADGIIYDKADKKVLAVCGDAGVLIPISPDVDPKGGSADPAIDLGGKPEFLAADGRGHVYVNLVNKDQVAVVDVKAAKVLEHRPTAPGGKPVGMAIDAEHRRLFIGCRSPQKMIVMDCDSGKVLADLPIGRGVDAVAFDDGCALASCGDGTITVVGKSSSGEFGVVQKFETRLGARTEGLNPDTHKLYLPTAELSTTPGARRPRPIPGSFMVVEVERAP